MPLSDTAVRSAKPREKAYKLSDEKGLYLQIEPNGSKFWRLKYRFVSSRATILSDGCRAFNPLRGRFVWQRRTGMDRSPT